MGLDMYLSKKSYVKNWDHMRPEERHEISVKKNGEPRADIKPGRISYIIEEIAYWRKFNALHKWFVDNCQNGVDECQESHVSFDQLKEVLDMCKKIKANNKLASKLLPTTSGFFFGDTEYSEWYFDDIDRTIEMLEPIVAEHDEQAYPEYVYRSSW